VALLPHLLTDLVLSQTLGRRRITREPAISILPFGVILVALSASHNAIQLGAL
jgi:hypothetical protein